MKNSQKNILLIIVLMVIVGVMIAFGVFDPKKKTDPTTSIPTPTPTQNVTVVPNGTCGLTILSHSVNSRVNFPLTISGVVDNTNMNTLGCSWLMFEGQAGSARLYYKSPAEGWKPIGAQIPVPVQNWMSTKTTFMVTFTNPIIDLVSGTELKVVFTEDNASGLPPIDIYELPLMYDPTAAPSPEQMELSIFLQDKQAVEQNDCTVTYKATFSVPKTSTVADASLKILFGDELKAYGTYQSVSIVGGIAKVMLASDKTPTGAPLTSLSSCQSGHLMSVLEDTLTQYPSIKKVELHSPEGKIEF